MFRMDMAAARISHWVNLTGTKTYNDPATGEPISERALMPFMPEQEITLEQAMKDWK
jgi:hypothetical protein